MRTRGSACDIHRGTQHRSQCALKLGRDDVMMVSTQQAPKCLLRVIAHHVKMHLAHRIRSVYVPRIATRMTASAPAVCTRCRGGVGSGCASASGGRVTCGTACRAKPFCRNCDHCTTCERRCPSANLPTPHSDATMNGSQSAVHSFPTCFEQRHAALVRPSMPFKLCWLTRLMQCVATATRNQPRQKAPGHKARFPGRHGCWQC